MAYTNKLDTNIITVTINTLPKRESSYLYSTSTGTVEINAVTAYYKYVDMQGFATNFTALIVSGSIIIVDETYATIDSLLNP